MTILYSILPIVLALSAGYTIGRFIPNAINTKLIRLISPLVWGMLFLIGSEFGEVISSAHSMGHILKTASIFAILTTLGPCILIFLLSTSNFNKPNKKRERLSFKHVWPPLKECCIALSMVLFGSAFFLLNETFLSGTLRLPSSSLFLLFLILLVGVDLTQIKLNANWFTISILFIPILVIVGSLLGAIAASWMTGENLKVSMALSSGFGWFTLSSVLIGNNLGQTYGSMALMTDLLRELFAVVILYAMGKHYPNISIGSAGATASDSTLPIIKQTCNAGSIPLAIVSGFLLTILAPIFITFFLS